MADELDQRLKAHFSESSQYLSDDGFSRAVMAHIPKTPVRRRWWLSKAVLTAGALIPAVAVLFLAPWAQLREAFWVMSLQHVLLIGVGFSVAVVAACLAWLLREIMA